MNTKGISKSYLSKFIQQTYRLSWVFGRPCNPRQASRSTYSEDSLRTLLKFEVFNVNHFQEKRSQTHQFFRLKISRN